MQDRADFFKGVAEEALFREAVRRFDDENSRDPNIEHESGQAWPRELLHALHLSQWVLTLSPNSSEELRLASRCQHICRWKIPRETYPMDRAGYHRWRNALKAFHANMAGQILREVGYSENVVTRVQDLNLKKHFPADPEARVLEDGLCLVFLQFQFADLAARTDEAKVINALQKSWHKMTHAAREHALRLSFNDRERRLLEKALTPT